MLLDNPHQAEKLFFAGRIQHAKELSILTHSEDAAIINAWIDLWEQHSPDRVYLVSQGDWRQLILGAYFSIRDGDDSLLSRDFRSQRQKEIAAFFRGFASWKNHGRCPTVPISDRWSIARRDYLRSWFEPYENRTAILLQAHREFLPESLPDAARSIRQSLAIAQETGMMLGEACSAYREFTFPRDMQRDEWIATIAYARISHSLGDVDAARAAFTRAGMMNVEPLQTYVETAGFALAIGERIWAQDQIERAYALWDQGEVLSDYHSSPVLSGVILSSPHYAKMLKDFTPHYTTNDSDERDGIGAATRLYVQGVTLQTKGSLQQAEALYLKAFAAYTILGFNYRAAITANRLQQVSKNPGEWREKAMSHAINFGPGLAQCVRQTMPRMNATRRTILDAVLLGWCDKEISERTNLAISTIKNNLHEIYLTFDVKDRSQLIAVLGASKVGTDVPGL